MSQSFYPSGAIRQNYFAHMYCEIALESFYDATSYYEKLKCGGFSCELYEDRIAMEKEIVSTIIFSAMTIEAFTNDYAAACLGDSEFYDNFDKLSVLSKFELIARFILKSNIDKSKAYYSYLKTLIKQRDSFVHNKSMAINLPKQSLEEVELLHEAISNSLVAVEHILNVQEIEADMRLARDAIKAIKAYADYFDQHDSSVYAASKLFNPSSIYYGTPKEQAYKQLVFPILGIKVSE